MSEVTTSAILSEYMDDAECAKQLGIAPITLARWRGRKQGPPVTKVGRSVFYRRSSVAAWLAEQETQLEHPKQAKRGAR
jgi:predicted DNA-binding transcriptional regulator AlpA